MADKNRNFRDFKDTTYFTGLAGTPIRILLLEMLDSKELVEVCRYDPVNEIITIDINEMPHILAMPGVGVPLESMIRNFVVTCREQFYLGKVTDRNFTVA